MQPLRSIAWIFALCLFSCNSANKHNTQSTTKDTVKKVQESVTTAKADSSYTEKDKEEMHLLVGNMLNWAEAKKRLDLVPVLTNGKDSICTGFDLEKSKLILEY